MKGLKGLLVLPKEPDDDQEEMDDDASSVGKKAAVDDIFDAFERKDKKAFASALDDFVDLCMSSHGEAEAPKKE